MIIPFIFIFDLRANKKMLNINILLFFIVIPIVSSIINIGALNIVDINIRFMGFSAVTSALFGYLAFSLINYLSVYHNIKFKKSIFQILWPILLLNFIWICLTYYYFIPLIFISVVLIVSFLNVHKDFLDIFLLTNKLNRKERTLVFSSLFLCLFMGFQLLFPENLKIENGTVNILSHYVGYVFGFIVPAIISVYLFRGSKNDM